MPSFFQSISAIFSGGGDGSLGRRDQTISSTHDAFSLPTHSPTFASQSFLAARGGDGTDSPSPSYTYPPAAQSPNGANYDYVPQSSYDTTATPTQATSSNPFTRSRPSSLLPLHHTPLAPLPPYPPPSHSWARLKAWLASEYPELGDTLNYGILPADLAQIELQFGFALPNAVRDSYLATDGQEAESSAGCSEGVFFGLTLLPLEDVLEEWRFWRDVDEDPQTGANPRLREVMQSIPPNWVRREYSQRGWIPLVADKAGNYMGVDMNPDSGGVPGQVIVFGRDFDTKVVMWRGEGEGGWAKWLAAFVEELEQGDGFEVGGIDAGSDDSEDDLGFESYFFDGSGGGNKGQGGGDRGVAGMRLIGEYKGWNVLEAWADRSVKKWKEVGLVPDGAYPLPEPGKAPDTKVVGTLPGDKSADVHIPVLADVSPALPPLPSAKPLPPRPAVKPLALPTRSDIDTGAPSPTSSIGSHTPIERHSDSLPMREVAPPKINIDSSALETTPRSPPKDLLTDNASQTPATDSDPLGAVAPVLSPVPASPSEATVVAGDDQDDEPPTPTSTIRLMRRGKGEPEGDEHRKPAAIQV